MGSMPDMTGRAQGRPCDLASCSVAAVALHYKLMQSSRMRTTWEPGRMDCGVICMLMGGRCRSARWGA